MTVPHPNLALMRGVPTIFLDENFAALDGAIGSTSINLLLNGDLRFWRQNGTSVAVPAGNFTFGPDMIAAQCVGSSMSMVRGVAGLGVYPGQPKYFMGVSCTSVAGINNFGRLLLQFEDVRIFAGKTLTLAFKSNSGSDGQLAIGIRQFFGTGGAPSTEVVTYVGTVALSSSAAVEEQSVTFTVPSIAGKTIGTDENSGFSIVLWFDAGTNLDAFTNSLGQHSFSCNLWDFRLNYGSLSIAQNTPVDLGARYLSLCRYYWKTFFDDTTPAVGLGVGQGEIIFPQGVPAGATQQIPGVYLPVQMRSAPAVTVYGVDVASNDVRAIGIGTWTGLVLGASAKHINITGVTPAGSGVGFTCGYHLTADATLVF